MWVIAPKSFLSQSRVQSHLLPGAISYSGLKLPAAPAEGFGAHIGGHKVVLHHTSGSAQQAGQPMGHTGGSVAGSFLGSDTDIKDAWDGGRRAVTGYQKAEGCKFRASLGFIVRPHLKKKIAQISACFRGHT